MGGGRQGDFSGARSLLQEVAAVSGLAPSVSPGSLEVATCHLTGITSHLTGSPGSSPLAPGAGPAPSPLYSAVIPGCCERCPLPTVSSTLERHRAGLEDACTGEESRGRTGMWGSTEDDRRAEQPGHRTSQATSTLCPMATADCPAPPPQLLETPRPGKGVHVLAWKL